MAPRVSYLVVTHDSSASLAAVLPAVGAELEAGDEVIVWDNASADGTPAAVSSLLPGARITAHAENLGFAAGANRAAAQGGGELLVFLNPDAVPAPGFGAAIRRPWAAEPGWGAWMGLVTMEGGTRVNTRGGEVHVTGLAWAGGAGEPAPSGAPDGASRGRRPVGFASGACLAVRRTDWDRLGGFPEDFFMYCEDVDFSLRLRLIGRGVGIEPTARVDHDYTFGKGPAKWRRLERNRWGVLARCFPGRVLLVVAPVLLAAEAAILLAALAGGWGREKLAAWGDAARALPRWRRERAAIQAARTVSAAEFADVLVPELRSPFLPAPARSAPVGALARAWWRLARALL